jgi:hypothetical protein
MVQERDTLEAAEQIAGADVESIRPLDREINALRRSNLFAFG